MKSAKVIKKPILIVIAGPNGSGKTSITKHILQHEWLESCLYINPDNIAKESYGDWNSPDAVLKAAKLSTEMRESCLKEEKSLVFETVLSAEDKIDFIQRAKNKGYFIRLFFISTESPAINARRVAQRVIEGGHDVPIPKIISRYSKSISNSAKIIKIIDRAYFYDNSIDDQDPQLLFRAVDGTLKKQYNKINNWAKPIFELVK